MKPSEFWAQIFALPEQARQAEQDASDLHVAANALSEWAKLAADIHRKAIVLADDGDVDTASAWLDELGHRPDPSARVVADAEPPAKEPPRPPRKQRSDAGKPRGRKTAVAIYDSDPDPPEVDESTSANPRRREGTGRGTSETRWSDS